MRESAILDRLSTGQQRSGGKVLRFQVGANLAVAANLEIIRQVRALADERNAAVQQAGFQFVWCHIFPVANMAVLAYNDLFVQNGTVNYAARADNGVKEYDGVADNRAFLDDHAWREHAALDLPLDDTAMGNQAFCDLRPFANMSGWPFLAACVNHPGRIIE